MTSARRLTPPSYADYVEFACLSWMRPGEIDALEWDQVDWEQNEIHVVRQVRFAARLDEMDFYLATRHHFGWYAINVLGLDPQVVAEQFGHRDGGELVRKLYGHPDRRRMRELIRRAHDAANGISSDPGAPTPPAPEEAGAVVLRPYFRRHDPVEEEQPAPTEVAA